MIASTKVLDGLQTTIIVHPSSSKSRFDVIDGVLHVYVCSPPTGGKANREVVKLLKKALGTPVEIRHGVKSKRKVVFLQGLDMADLEGFLETIQ